MPKKKRTTIRTAGPDDPIYHSGWGTCSTLGSVWRQMQREGYQPSPEMEASINRARKELGIDKRTPSR